MKIHYIVEAVAEQNDDGVFYYVPGGVIAVDKDSYHVQFVEEFNDRKKDVIMLIKEADVAGKKLLNLIRRRTNGYTATHGEIQTTDQYESLEELTAAVIEGIVEGEYLQ